MTRCEIPIAFEILYLSDNAIILPAENKFHEYQLISIHLNNKKRSLVRGKVFKISLCKWFIRKPSFACFHSSPKQCFQWILLLIKCHQGPIFLKDSKVMLKQIQVKIDGPICCVMRRVTYSANKMTKYKKDQMIQSHAKKVFSKLVEKCMTYYLCRL